MNGLEDMVSSTVLVITQDGRVLKGSLQGFDNVANLILKDCAERVFSPSGPVEEVQLGLFVIRGSEISMIAEVDVDVDAKVNWGSVRADPMKPITF